MNIPHDRVYLPTHEWHKFSKYDQGKFDNNVVTIGITHIAANSLSNITYIDLPPVGTKLIAGRPFGEIESTKMTSDLYSGISGVVTEVNMGLKNLNLINSDPYENGWIIRVRANLSPMLNFLTADEYQKSNG